MFSFYKNKKNNPAELPLLSNADNSDSIEITINNIDIISSIPDEIKIHIAQFLSYRESANFFQANRALLHTKDKFSFYYEALITEKLSLIYQRREQIITQIDSLCDELNTMQSNFIRMHNPQVEIQLQTHIDRGTSIPDTTFYKSLQTYIDNKRVFANNVTPQCKDSALIFSAFIFWGLIFAGYFIGAQFHRERAGAAIGATTSILFIPLWVKLLGCIAKTLNPALSNDINAFYKDTTKLEGLLKPLIQTDKEIEIINKKLYRVRELFNQNESKYAGSEMLLPRI